MDNVEKLDGIVIEVIVGDVLYEDNPIYRLTAESQDDFIAKGRAWINSHHTPAHNPSGWSLRWK